MWPTLFAYVLSFVIIATYWVNHHYLIHLVTRVDATILWANMNLLFWISLVPWVTGYLGDNHALPFPVALYPAVPAAGAISFFFLRASIALFILPDSDGRRLQLHTIGPGAARDSGGNVFPTRARYWFFCKGRFF